MSDNKLIKFLDMLWGCYWDRHAPSDKDKVMLTEIKQILSEMSCRKSDKKLTITREEIEALVHNVKIFYPVTASKVAEELFESKGVVVEK